MSHAPREQYAPLIRVFLARFFENEITRGTDDLKSSFFWLTASLTGPGIYIPVMMSFHWSITGLIKGAEVLRVESRGDKAFYLGLAIVASAIVSAITWNSLLPDRRDALILGAMPVRPSRIVASKLAALAMYIATVAIAMHTLAAILFGFGLSTGAGFGFLIRGIAGHFVASLAASAFVFLSLAGVQGVTLAALGPRLFARVSPVLQLLLVGAIVGMLLVLPVINSSVVDTLRGSGRDLREWILLTPPLWFLGIYEWMLGTRDPQLLRLAGTGALAFLAAVCATAVSYPVAYRRVMVSTVEA